MHLLLKQQQGKMYVMYVDAALQNDLQLEMILNYFFFLALIITIQNQTWQKQK